MEEAIAVANYFIDKSIHDPDPRAAVTNMKLIKLVYIAHGWYLAMYDRPLIKENAEAWKYGPVIPTVYEEFRHHGGEYITEKANGSFWKSNSRYELTEREGLAPFLDKVWNTYGYYTGGQLMNLTHQVGTPWEMTWHHYGGRGGFGVTILNPLIQSHYRDKLETNKKANAAAEPEGV
jgi:uncharacterized phage-associated protein